ncbi:uncharacterized protein METZ01_LOCUS513633, partial [marine metagenome]
LNKRLEQESIDLLKMYIKNKQIWAVHANNLQGDMGVIPAFEQNILNGIYSFVKDPAKFFHSDSDVPVGFNIDGFDNIPERVYIHTRINALATSFGGINIWDCRKYAFIKCITSLDELGEGKLGDIGLNLFTVTNTNWGKNCYLFVPNNELTQWESTLKKFKDYGGKIIGYKYPKELTSFQLPKKPEVAYQCANELKKLTETSKTYLDQNGKIAMRFICCKENNFCSLRA